MNSNAWSPSWRPIGRHQLTPMISPSGAFSGLEKWTWDGVRFAVLKSAVGSEVNKNWGFILLLYYKIIFLGDTAEGEHRRWNASCPFLQARDVGNVPLGMESGEENQLVADGAATLSPINNGAYTY